MMMSNRCTHTGLVGLAPRINQYSRKAEEDGIVGATQQQPNGQLDQNHDSEAKILMVHSSSINF